MRNLWFGTSLLIAAGVFAACGVDSTPGDGTSTPDGGTSDGGTPKDGSSPSVDGGSPQPDAGEPAATFTIGGTVSGLQGTGLVLQNNDGDDIPIAKDGTFTFSKKLAAGGAYKVTIKTQPSAPTQTCSVSGGTGTIANGNITSVLVNCATDKFAVGGSVSGLAGSGLVLQNNAGDDLIVNANGTFAFPTTVSSGGAYAVTVKTQPSDPSQTCVVTSGTGTIDKSPVSDVAVVCTTNKLTVGGSVTGLAGSGLVLQINGGETVSISGDGPFVFPTAIDSGSSFTVTVSAQPSNPTQTCTVGGGTGTIGAANVTSVAVKCSTNKFLIGGTATGVAGSGLVLQNNGGDDLPVTANGSFAFATPIESGATYAVSVKNQPTSPSQTCTLGSESGTVSGSDVTNVALNCTTNAYKVSGTVTGLAGSGLVLQNNGGDDFAVSADGTFSFSTSVLSGQTYNVTVSGQPSNLSQTCTVTGGTGTIGGGDVTDVAINCTTNKYTVTGTVTGLVGSGLVLKNNNGDDLPILTDGTFTFVTPILSGGAYAVTVGTNPTGPSQTCTVSAGSGTITNGNVTAVAVNCATDKFTVGGSVTGLAGTGLVLQNNGGDDITVNGNGNFAFGTAIASGAGYSVSVKTQPTVPSQTCTVTNSTGNVGAGPVTNVSISCTTNTYKIGGTLSGASGTVVLTNNGGDDLTVNANSSFNFATKIASGSAYSVAVKTPPVGQGCVVTNGSGTVGAADVTNVSVTCSAAICRSNGAGDVYCYLNSDSVQTRALKACEAHFGVGNCCVIGGGYQSQQYGKCGSTGYDPLPQFHWDNHPNGHCAPNYVVGDVVSPGWCGTIIGNFLTGGFSTIDTNMNGLNKPQTTRCESVTNGGKTCNNPIIKYGSVDFGVPAQHPGDDFTKWCQSLGFSGFTSVTYGNRSYAAPAGKLFGCSLYDDNVWHWCDWQDGPWYNQSLDYHPGQDGQAITSITCN